MSKLSLRTTATPTEKDLQQFIDLLASSHQTVPLTTAFITEIDGVGPDSQYAPITADRLKQHFSLGLPAAFRSNVLLTTVSHASNSSQPVAAMLFEPPDFSGTPPSQARKKPGPILTQYRAIARELKAKHMAMPDSGPRMWDTPASPSQASSGPSGDPFPSEFNKDAYTEVRTFYHLALMVRDGAAPQEQTLQAVKEAMQVYMDKAKATDVPILLETSVPEARDRLVNWGFETLEEVQVGVGKVDARGWPNHNGEGVKVWGMVYNA